MHGGALPRNPVLVTFDDGDRDNFDVTLPILQRHGVTAVFFIATAYVTGRHLFWWDRLTYLVTCSRRARLALSYPRDLVLPLVTAGERAAAIGRVLRIVKTEVGLDLDRFLGAVAAAAGVVWTEALERTLADAALMTWDQVRALRRAGMDVQSHTRTHRVLQTLAPAQLRDELCGSKADLERELDAPVVAISYPRGARRGRRRARLHERHGDPAAGPARRSLRRPPPGAGPRDPSCVAPGPAGGVLPVRVTRNSRSGRWARSRCSRCSRRPRVAPPRDPCAW